MAEEIKELIRKIQEEGVQAAEARAGQIERQAQQKADVIAATAQAQAALMIEEAQEKIKTLQANSEAGLKQAGRDMLLSLKTEVNAMLDRLIRVDVGQALSADELAKILSSLIKDYCGHEAKDVIVFVKEEDRQKLEANFLGKLRQEVKKGLELKASDQISSGFIISFDAGKSQFDFTDAALAEYVSQILKPKLAELLAQTPSA